MNKKNKIAIVSGAMAVLIAATIGVSASFMNAPQDVVEPEDVGIVIENSEPTIAEDENEMFAPEEPVVEEKITEEVEEVVPSSTYTYTEPTYQSYTPTYSEPTYTQQYQQNGSGLTKEGGVNQYNGRTETWYSSNVLYHYRTPEWTAGADGVYRDADGYVVVAASDVPMGSVIDSSYGPAKVYDTGCAAGVTDIYTNW